MSFILVRFNGGLGNQLFQYAMARAVMKNGDALLFDIASFSDDYLGRIFGLQQYAIKGTILKHPKVLNLFRQGTKLNRVANRLGLFKSVKEAGFYVHNSDQITTKYFTYIEGYWQSEKYFSSLRNALLMELKPQKMPIALPTWIHQPNTVAVHVRRTDYLNDERYGFLGEAYYQAALGYIRSRVANPLFVFFSDDLVWCKKMFKEADVLLCEEVEWQADYLQLYLISKCAHQIIANSSFSWWGAWLNTNSQKIVIKPNMPFKDMRLLYQSHYPETWISI